MTVGVVIPWRHEPARVGAVEHVEQHLRLTLAPPWTMARGRHDEVPWVKALAVADGLRKCPGGPDDILVLHDADVIVPGLLAAIEAVVSGEARWAIPHGQVRRLDEPSTAVVLAGGELRGRLTEAAYYGHAGGGCTVLRRADYESVPLDPRFVGWGREDDAWALALRSLLGEPWRGTEPCWHLFHPPQPRENRKYGSDANNALYRRYHEATGYGPAAMRALVDEALTSYPDSGEAVRTFSHDAE